MSDFKNSNKGGSVINSVDLSVEILTSGHWPYQDVPKCTIPAQLNSVQTHFTKFYKNKFSNRQLVYLYSHGTVQVSPTYLNKPYQFILSCYQASIVTMFNT